MNVRKINQYRTQWMACGYPGDIPDEVPVALMHLKLAPSYKAIALAILKNDATLQTLGFSQEDSPWYIELKRMEIAARVTQGPHQLRLIA